MRDFSLSFLALSIFLTIGCQTTTPPADTGIAPEDVLIQWQSYIDQDLYDSARIISTAEALEFVNFLQSITDFSDSDRVVSITLLRELACKIQGDSAICTYLTKDEIGNDIGDTVILKRINNQWRVAKVYDIGAPPLDSLLEGDMQLIFPSDSVDEEYQ